MKLSLLATVGAVLILAAGCATSPRTAASTAPATVVASPAQPQLLVISAVFGSDTKFADVTARVNDLLSQSPHFFRVRPRRLLTDPTPGEKKTLVIIYEYKGQRHTFTTKSGDRVSLQKLENA